MLDLIQSKLGDLFIGPSAGLASIQHVDTLQVVEQPLYVGHEFIVLIELQCAFACIDKVQQGLGGSA